MFDDAIYRAVKHRFANEIMEALREESPQPMRVRKNYIELPLRADARVLYNHDLAAFSIEGYVNDVDRNKCLMVNQVFSTREFISTKEKAEMIEYLFDKVKQQFLHALAYGELDAVLGVDLRKK